MTKNYVVLYIEDLQNYYKELAEKYPATVPEDLINEIYKDLDMIKVLVKGL